MDIKAYLAEQGLTPEEITALVGNEKAAKAMSAALSKFDEGTEALTKAQEQHAWNQKYYEDEIAPGLTKNDGRLADADAELAMHRARWKSLKEKGYDVPEAYYADGGKKPTDPQQQQRDPDTGKYVTPEQMRKEFSTTAPTMVALTQLAAEYTDLFGAPYLAMEQDYADAQKIRQPLREFVRNKYKFADKRAEREQAKLQKDKEAYAVEKVAAAQKEWAERTGKNPDLRSGVPSKHDLVKKFEEHKDSWKTQAGREAAQKQRLEKYENVH